MFLKTAKQFTVACLCCHCVEQAVCVAYYITTYILCCVMPIKIKQQLVKWLELFGDSIFTVFFFVFITVSHSIFVLCLIQRKRRIGSKQNA